MAKPTSFYSVTYADNTLKNETDPETSSFEVPVTTLTAANLVAQTALINDLQIAVDNLTIGQLNKTAIIQNRTQVSISNSPNVAAQRECKLLLRYHDNTDFTKFRVSIPTFDLTALESGNEYLDLEADEGLALKTAFEAIVRSPNDASHAVTLDSAQHVGRNT